MEIMVFVALETCFAIIDLVCSTWNEIVSQNLIFKKKIFCDTGLFAFKNSLIK